VDLVRVIQSIEIDTVMEIMEPGGVEVVLEWEVEFEMFEQDVDVEMWDRDDDYDDDEEDMDLDEGVEMLAEGEADVEDVEDVEMSID